jgi:flagellar protein FlbD
MIRLHRLDGKEFVLNCDLIRQLEAMPDTLITLTTGEKLLVADTVEQVTELARAYRRSLHAPELR